MLRAVRKGEQPDMPRLPSVELLHGPSEERLGNATLLQIERLCLLIMRFSSHEGAVAEKWSRHANSGRIGDRQRGHGSIAEKMWINRLTEKFLRVCGCRITPA